MTEADIRTRQLQQIPVFALSREVQRLADLDGMEAILRQRMHRVLQRNPRSVKAAVQRLTHEQLVLLVNACPEIADERIQELFEEYRRENPDNPGQPREGESSPMRVKVDQQVGAISGGKIVGVAVDHAEQVAIEQLNVKGSMNIIVTADRLDRFHWSLTWIRVAGLGKVSLLPDHTEVYYASRAVGRSIADSGFGLLVGGWSGVDYVVAESFAAELRRLERPLSEYLLQVVPQGKMPQFRGGQVVHAGEGWLTSVDIMRKANAVVLIGGAGGTHETYEYALQERKPVFPLAGTHGDAQRVFQEMLASWDAQPMGAVPLDQFARVLSQKVTSEDEARRIAEELLVLIRLRLGS